MSAPGDVRSVDGASTQLIDFVAAPGAIQFTSLSARPPIASKVQLYAFGGQVEQMDPAGNITTVLNGDPVASQQGGMLGWNFDPSGGSQTFTLPTAGSVMLTKIILTRTATLTNALVCMSTAGATLTSGQNFMGLYDVNGNRLAVTADQTSAFGGTTGLITGAFTTPVTNAAPGTYYLAVVFNGTTGPTLIAASALRPNNISVGNLALGAAQARWLIGPTSQTSLPASITLGSQSLNVGATWWAALS